MTEHTIERNYHSAIPPLPPEIIERVRQLSDDADRPQWTAGYELVAILDELVPVYAALPELGSARRARTWIVRKLCDGTGGNESTMRDRISIARFYLPEARRKYDMFSYSQMRAFKSAGPDKWEEYAQYFLDHLPAPVRVIRERIRANGAEPTEPAWKRKWERFLDLAYELAQDEETPERLKRAADCVIDVMREEVWGEHP